MGRRETEAQRHTCRKRETALWRASSAIAAAVAAVTPQSVPGGRIWTRLARAYGTRASMSAEEAPGTVSRAGRAWKAPPVTDTEKTVRGDRHWYSACTLAVIMSASSNITVE